MKQIIPFVILAFLIVINISVTGCTGCKDNNPNIDDELVAFYDNLNNDKCLYTNQSSDSIEIIFEKEFTLVDCGDECDECEIINVEFEVQDILYSISSNSRNSIFFLVNDSLIFDYDFKEDVFLLSNESVISKIIESEFEKEIVFQNFNLNIVEFTLSNQVGLKSFVLQNKGRYLKNI